MSGRDEDPLASCLEEQQKGEVQQNQWEQDSQSLSEGSIIMGEHQTQKANGTEAAQHKGQKVLDPTHHTMIQMELELQRSKAQAEMFLMLNPPRIPTHHYSDPFITTKHPCQGFYGLADLLSKELTGPGKTGRHAITPKWMLEPHTPAFSGPQQSSQPIVRSPLKLQWWGEDGIQNGSESSKHRVPKSVPKRHRLVTLKLQPQTLRLGRGKLHSRRYHLGRSHFTAFHLLSPVGCGSKEMIHVGYEKVQYSINVNNYKYRSM